ncbi:MAG: stage III sporulation protein AF [Clostridiales bacterium]
MTVIGEIVRNIVSLLLVGAFLELLIPNGELAKFVRLALGLVLLTMIIQPLAGQNKDINIQEELARLSGIQSVSGQAYVAEGAQLAKHLQGDAYGQYQTELSRQIEAVVLLDATVAQAAAQPEVDLSSGKLVGLTVLIEPGAGQPDHQRLANSLSGFFAVDSQYIMIQEVDFGD